MARVRLIGAGLLTAGLLTACADGAGPKVSDSDTGLDAARFRPLDGSTFEPAPPTAGPTAAPSRPTDAAQGTQGDALHAGDSGAGGGSTKPDGASHVDAVAHSDGAAARDGSAAKSDGAPIPTHDAQTPVADVAVPLAPDVPSMPPPPPVRFIAIGDTGKGNARQHQVAAAMEQVCVERGPCDFALLLGDNMYDSGTDDVNDAQWQEKFEAPYANLNFPFYATLGNHDYGAPDFASDFAGGLGTDPVRGATQVEYTQHSQKWRMPDTFYRFEAGPVEFVSLNTTSVFWADLPILEQIIGFDRENARQRATLPMWEDESRSRWRIAFAHHPYLSNGDHGNAGSYDFVFINGLIGSGTAIAEFLDEYVIGHFDAYLCGHDHNLQDLGDVRGTQLLLSGAGASTDDLIARNPTEWESEGPGFLFVEATNERLEFTFVLVHEEGGPADFEYAHTRSIQ